MKKSDLMMKIIVAFFLVLPLCQAKMCAQIVSPGTGITFTFNDLVYDPSGAVTSSQPGFYEVHQNLTLAANGVLLLAALSVLGATLTLPGLSGIALTIGMAVDANI